MKNARRIPIGILACGAAACGGAPPGENACGTGPSEASGSADHPTSRDLNSEIEACMGSRAEVHHYQLSAPDDVTGGYVQASLTGMGMGSMLVTTYAGGETVELAHFVPESLDAPVAFFLAVAPGQPYRIAIANQGAFAAPYTFRLATAYTAVPDVFEPNDSVAAAPPIVVDVPVQAYLFAGRGGTDDSPVPYDDYYRFVAASGTITIRIEDVATDLAPRITLYATDGAEIARVASGIKGGALVMLSPALAAPGELVVRVSPWSTAPPSTGAGTLLPDHFTRPYKLSVSQP